MKHLLVIHTGGTISMSQDQSNKEATKSPYFNASRCHKSICTNR